LHFEPFVAPILLWHLKEGVLEMMKWLCCLYGLAILVSSNVYAKELPDSGELEQRLLLLDKISYASVTKISSIFLVRSLK
jgi:hypothetical protein